MQSGAEKREEEKGAKREPKGSQMGAKGGQKGAKMEAKLEQSLAGAPESKEVENGSRRFFCIFDARRKKGRFRDPPGGPAKVVGANKNRFGQKGVRARRFFSRSGRTSTENGEKAEIGVLPRRERHFGGAGGSERDPRRPPESRKRPPRTLQNRSGANFGHSGRDGDFRENAETRPEARNGKSVRKGGPFRDPPQKNNIPKSKRNEKITKKTSKISLSGPARVSH